VTAVAIASDVRVGDGFETPGAPIDPQRQRLGFFIWALLFANGLAFIEIPTIITIPSSIGKILTQGALALATVLVLVFNRRRLVRPNLFLALFTLLAASSLMMSVRMATGFGSLFRAGRFCTFIAVLWLLSPLWGRRDRLVLRWHMTCLTIVLSTVVIGFFVKPGGRAAIDGRLYGQLWPIPPTQVAHYAAVLAGIAFVLLLTGAMRARPAWFIGGTSVVVLIMTHTRTALIAMLVGLACAMLTLLTSRHRVRQTMVGGILVLVLAGTLFAPQVSSWFHRGETAQQVGGLNGRTQVWHDLIHEPRSRFNEVFGIGLTNKSFGGLSIDNSWLATFQDQGLFGVAICAAVLIALLMLAATRPRGPCLAVAIFLIVYCLVASWTEVGLGDVSPYVLDLAVAAALLAGPGDAAVAALAPSKR
jgi:O-Antigen ligase